MKTVDFSETIAVCDLKVGSCRQLIKLMKMKILAHLRSFRHLGQRSFTFENLTLLFSETTGPFSTNFVCKPLETILYKFH